MSLTTLLVNFLNNLFRSLPHILVLLPGIQKSSKSKNECKSRQKMHCHIQISMIWINSLTFFLFFIKVFQIVWFYHKLTCINQVSWSRNLLSLTSFFLIFSKVKSCFVAFITMIFPWKVNVSLIFSLLILKFSHFLTKKDFC